MAVKLALEFTVITMLFLGIMALLISRIKQKNTCPICGDPCQGKFCCEAHELLHYSEEEFSRDDWLDAEEDEALAEQKELERQERISKALP
jgi:hypothetical protein